MDGNEKIAIVEDDEVIREVVKMTLRRAGYTRICVSGRGDEGLWMVEEERPDVLLLDLMLPGLDGMTVCRRLRANEKLRSLGIIMLTAKGEPEDVVAGLEAGADDYVVKPFSRSILVARIAALLRRKAPPANTELDGLSIDAESGAISLDGEALSLTKTEHRMLTAFVKHPARVYTRALLSEIATGEAGGTDDGGRTVDVQIAGLRKKLGRWAGHVETIRGVGYRVKP